jgi:hypothetical protein
MRVSLRRMTSPQTNPSLNTGAGDKTAGAGLEVPEFMSKVLALISLAMSCGSVLCLGFITLRINYNSLSDISLNEWIYLTVYFLLIASPSILLRKSIRGSSFVLVISFLLLLLNLDEANNWHPEFGASHQDLMFLSWDMFLISVAAEIFFIISSVSAAIMNWNRISAWAANMYMAICNHASLVSIVAAIIVAYCLFTTHISYTFFQWENVVMITFIGFCFGLALNYFSGFSVTPAFIIFAPLLCVTLLLSIFSANHLIDIQLIGAFGGSMLFCTVLTRLARKRPNPSISRDASDKVACTGYVKR